MAETGISLALTLFSPNYEIGLQEASAVAMETEWYNGCALAFLQRVKTPIENEP